MIILNFIAYLPLIIISLLVVYSIIYAIWRYYTAGDLPNNLLKAFNYLKWLIFKF